MTPRRCPPRPAFTFFLSAGRLEGRGPCGGSAQGLGLREQSARALAAPGRAGHRLRSTGRAPARPKDFPRTRPSRNWSGSAKEIAPIAAKHGITIAAEAISKRADQHDQHHPPRPWPGSMAVGHPNFQFMVRPVSPSCNRVKDPTVLRKAHPHIAYAKIANPAGSRVSRWPTDAYALRTVPEGPA